MIDANKFHKMRNYSSLFIIKTTFLGLGKKIMQNMYIYLKSI